MGAVAIGLVLMAIWLELIMGLKISAIRGVSLLNLTLAGLVVIWGLNALRTGRWFRPHPANRWLLLLVAYALALIPLKALLNEVPGQSMGAELMDLKNWANPFFLFLAASQFIEKQRDVHRAFAILCVMVALTLGLSASLAALGLEFGTFKAVKGNRLAGFSEPNQYAAMIVLFLPLFFGAALHARETALKAAAALTGAVGLVVLALTGSRGGLLSLVAALGVWMALGRGERKDAPALGRRLALIAAVACAVGLSFVLGQDAGALVQRFADTSQGGLDAYTSGRFTIYITGMDLFLERPIFGHGAGTFPDLMETRIGLWQNSHNDYLLFLVERGILGLLLFLGLMGSLFLFALRLWRSMGPRAPHRWVLTAYLGGFAGYAAAMLTVNIIDPRYLFWLYSALATRLGALGAFEPEGTPP